MNNSLYLVQADISSVLRSEIWKNYGNEDKNEDKKRYYRHYRAVFGVFS